VSDTFVFEGDGFIFALLHALARLVPFRIPKYVQPHTVHALRCVHECLITTVKCQFTIADIAFHCCKLQTCQTLFSVTLTYCSLFILCNESNMVENIGQ